MREMSFLGSLHEGAGKKDILLVPDNIQEGAIRLELQGKVIMRVIMIMPVAAAASVPSSFTSMVALCSTWDTKISSGDSSRLLNSAALVNIFEMPS